MLSAWCCSGSVITGAGEESQRGAARAPGGTVTRNLGPFPLSASLFFLQPLPQMALPGTSICRLQPWFFPAQAGAAVARSVVSRGCRRRLAQLGCLELQPGQEGAQKPLGKAPELLQAAFGNGWAPAGWGGALWYGAWGFPQMKSGRSGLCARLRDGRIPRGEVEGAGEELWEAERAGAGLQTLSVCWGTSDLMPSPIFSFLHQQHVLVPRCSRTWPLAHPRCAGASPWHLCRCFPQKRSLLGQPRSVGCCEAVMAPIPVPGQVRGAGRGHQVPPQRRPPVSKLQ